MSIIECIATQFTNMLHAELEKEIYGTECFYITEDNREVSELDTGKEEDDEQYHDPE